MSDTPRTDRETYTVKACDIGFQVVPVSCAKALEHDLGQATRPSLDEAYLRAEFERMHRGRRLTRHHLRGTYSSPAIAALWNQHVKTATMFARIALPLTEGEKHVLVHSLTGSGDGKVYRNYFAASPGHDDLPHIRRLLARGFMVKGRCYSNDGQSYYYHCTAAGAAAIGLQLP